MNRRVVVSFGAGRSHVVDVSGESFALVEEDDARAWLTEHFAEFGCEPPNPMGKLLTTDLVLGVARGAGEERFAEASPWRTQFAASVLRLRAQNAVAVDVAEHQVRAL